MKTKSPLAGVLAKKNRVGFSSIDVVAKENSHPFVTIIADIVRKRNPQDRMGRLNPLRGLFEHQVFIRQEIPQECGCDSYDRPDIRP